MGIAYLVGKEAAGPWPHLGAHPLRGLAWRSWQICSLHESQSPGEVISGWEIKMPPPACTLRVLMSLSNLDRAVSKDLHPSTYTIFW